MDHVPGSDSANAPAWHAMPCPQVIDRLQSDGGRGLDQAAAAARLAAGGRNRLPAPQPDAPVVVLLRQFRSPLVYVLLLAAGLALLLGHVTDAGFIGVVLLVNSLLGAWQELQAERQSANLQGLLRVRATVQRDGSARQVDAEELVDGDVVLLESGDRVPADLRLLEARGLEVDASLLTGESLPVLRDAGALCVADVAPPDRINCAHAGTLVVRGRGRGIVIATGLQTEVGRLARAMVATVAGKPPLTARMERFSRAIAWVVLVAAVLIGAIAVLVHDQPVFTMFTFGVALAVSAIPEGLPVAVTVALAIAARRMAQRGAIVRQLPAVEGLGSCSLIASDKTGTLTCNELTAVELVLDDGSRWSASGAGYAPAGEIRVEDGAGPDSAERLRQVLRIAAACNEAEILRHDGRWEYRGDPTDLALLALAGKGGVERTALLGEWPCVDRLAYEPERRYAATFHQGAGGSWTAVKGAPERVFELCTLDAALRARMQREVMALAAAGKRVLALAEGHAGRGRAPDGGPAEPSGLTLRGVVGLVDPLRPGAAEAVARCRAAGIRVAMITGDHPVTALAIARDLGIAQTADEVVAGPALAGLDAPGLRADRRARNGVRARHPRAETGDRCGGAVGRSFRRGHGRRRQRRSRPALRQHRRCDGSRRH